MVNPLEITYYARTGYNPSDEPASDVVIDLNEHWAAPLLLKEYDPSKLEQLNVQLSDADLHRVDYLKITDTITGERWYYYVAGHKRINEKVVAVRVILDNFATVGLQNIAFFGNIARRSLSAAERSAYPLLPEPWAPRRPLKTRRVILDFNVNKVIKVPSHISTTFEESATHIEHPENPLTIDVPTTVFGPPTKQDSLSFSTDLPMGYLNAAADTSHTINTPWGSLTYQTPYEQYLTLSGTALSTFLAKAKKYNALDLIEPPYYVPNPPAQQTVTISELSNPNIQNPKASRYYTTITIRSLAGNSAQTYSENNTRLQYDQSLTIIIAPDKNGGIYVIPTTIRDTGLNAYTYLDGVYSPFETVMYNAVGDTPAKFAADGTLLLNTALNDLFLEYVKKVNALQLENMQAKYLKDLVSHKAGLLSLGMQLLASTTTTITETPGYRANSVNYYPDENNPTGRTITDTPATESRSVSQNSGGGRSIAEGSAEAEAGGADAMEDHDDSASVPFSMFRTALFGEYRNEVHTFMLGNINDYLNRWVSIQNDMQNGKTANLFKNVTLVGNYNDYNKLVGKYEILIASLQPEDEYNFDLFLSHFGHAVDEYTSNLVTDAGGNYNYTMVGEDAIITNSVQQDANAPILNQFRTGVRVWKTLIRASNY